ncbi:fumarylacetoacetate hydrolase family protein [Bosea sp. RCC_152_1]|uniref:fumarylacetoacetate hydrolase family protein n=1 Tax=Bosea sp. RCC_152_1 TaxID=3239228 RepID=UPI003523986E
MKLATVQSNGSTYVAIVEPTQKRVWPLQGTGPDIPAAVGSDMVAAIAHLVTTDLSFALRGEGVPLSDVKILAPIPNPPRNIMCVGKNYHAHAREFAKSGFDTSATSAADAIPAHPIIFTKPATAITGPGSDIPMVPGLDAAIDYEAELAVVIGKKGRCIRREDAMQHVFGYTVLNDVTARDLQLRHKQWFLGKGIDGFCPMGPWIVTADELDGQDLRVSCRVNGELRQDASTATLIFDISTLIEVISRSVELMPGDVIATGTPEGVGIGFQPPRFLRDGDVVECEISGIGVLSNTVRRVSAHAA